MSSIGGWFGGPASSHSNHRSTSHSHSKSHRRESSPKGAFVRPRSPSRKNSSPKGYFVRPHSPERRRSEHGGGDGVAGIFGIGGGARSGSPARSSYSSTSRGFGSWFGGGRHASSSSYYKRRPRDGYISRLMYQIKRLWRNLVRYARENPIKLFMLVIMPLVTGGALHKILQSMGVRLPPGISKMMGGGREGYDGPGGAGGGAAGGLDIGQVMNVAKMFI